MASRKNRINFYRYSSNVRYKPPKRFEMVRTEYERFDYYITRRYGITKHCVDRCIQRVFFSSSRVHNLKFLTVAKWIVARLPFKLDKALDGIYPFLDDYVVVILDRRAVTIRPKVNSEHIQKTYMEI